MTTTLGERTKACPRCGIEQESARDVCVCCGVVFAKLRGAATPPPPPLPAAMPEGARGDGPAPELYPGARIVPDEVEEHVESGGLTRQHWLLLGGGLAAALLAHAFPLTRFLLGMFVVLLHELGHAAAAWVLGCPAVPAFDMVYGGGVTYHQEFETPLAVFVGLGLAALGWWLRGRPRVLAALGLVAALWLLVVVSEWRRQLVISAAGHGAELVFAGVFLWMALSGVGWRAPDFERPLGAFVAFFTALHALSFALRLRGDEAFLAEYMAGKGGAMMNDLEHIALDLKIWLAFDTSVPELAGLFALLVPLPLAAAFLLHFFRGHARSALEWLFAER